MQMGHLDALDEDEVVAMLQHRGLLVTSISRKDIVDTARLISRRQRHLRMHAGVKTEDQVLLCQQLATLVDAGIPLLKSLEVVCSQVESKALLIALEEIHRDVEAGRTFRDGLSKHPAIFSRLWLNLVETGEASGHLAQSLNQLARHFEGAEHLQNEVKTALTYPMFLLVAGIGVLCLFVYWLIPRFTGMFKSMGVELPLLTQIVIGVSDGARQYFLLILGSVVLAVFLLRRYLRTESGQWMRDRLLLRLPLFSALFTNVQLTEFSRGLSTLLESGVPLLSSLEILEKSMTNRVYGQAVGSIKDYVKEGKTMAEPMEQSGMFPPMAVQMVQVGEEVGELGKMIARVARYYEERINIFIARMSRLFEPIAIIVMAVFVLVIVLSIYLPIFKMASSAHAG